MSALYMLTVIHVNLETIVYKYLIVTISTLTYIILNPQFGMEITMINRVWQ